MDNSTGKTALALVAGIAAGAVLGLLFAPRSGKETRAALRGKAEDLQEGLEERIAQARKDWSKAKGKMSDAASMSKEEVTDFIRYMFKNGKHNGTPMEEEATAAQSDMADRSN